MFFRHRFQVHAPLSKVAEFHSQSAGMAAITPPPLIVQLHHAPPTLQEGDTMDFSLKLGALGIRWLAQIEGVTSAGFTDRQLRGPFAEWVHQHKFSAVDENTTDVIDEINLRLSRDPIMFFLGLGMRLGLPFLFAFRAWKTRRLLA
ncbi:MAG: hypothetical protein JW987_12645 [Anaerolineaceae bacterium]|nr:hypothetical protein [Anaerolineaceae bacterium]